jgi:AAHS family 4-hydroxybenzoate transporter-like MFS transporter
MPAPPCGVKTALAAAPASCQSCANDGGKTVSGEPDPVDEQPLSRLQMTIIVLCAMVALFDGADTFSIGIAAPSIAAKLAFPLNIFGSVFSAALFGATIGAFGFGPLADRFGRKPMLLIAVLVFAAFTFATALTPSYQVLLLVRFLAGVGLGGATPCFLTLAAEFVPTRLRAPVTSLLWSGFPLGGMLGSFLNSWLIGAYGWPAMFHVGGIAPLIVAALLWLFVPKPPRTLGAGERAAASPVKNLFADGRALATPLLWVPFFMAFGVLVIVVLWTPALLRQGGMSAPDAALVVGFHGLGGFLGMAAAGVLLEKYGTRVLVPAFVIGALFTLLLGMVGTSVPLAALCDALIGVFVGIGASGMIAVASLVYPAAIRSTGIGWAMAMGRLGQVAAPLIAGAMLQAGWPVGKMFLLIAAAPLIAAIFVPLVTLAFPSTRRRASRPALV